MWDILLVYAQHDPRWFEPLSRYAPGPELLAVYREFVPGSWSLTRRGLWFIAHPPGDPGTEQGWKLHVSSHPDRAADTLRSALPILVDAGVPFKFLLDSNCVAATMRKRSSRSSSGKFITAYPATADEFREIAKALAAAVDTADGPVAPFVLTDRRVPGSTSVYYRYGGFRAMSRLRPDGAANLMIRDPDGVEHPDVRNPYYSAPPWVADPFGEPEPDTATPTLADGRFVITDALTHTNAGGVYTAIDQTTGREVVIKEARRGVLIGQIRADATEILEREYRILNALSDVDPFITPVAFFREWEHAFLVEEYVKGAQMSQRQIATNPAVTTDLTESALRSYYAQQRQRWLVLAAAVRSAHQRGILLGDMSFTNVLLRESDDKLVVIDLEAAVQVGVDEPLGLYTPGVANPRARELRTTTKANDFYCLGALMLGSIMLVNAGIGYWPSLRDSFLTALAADLALPNELVELISELTDPYAPDEGPDPDSVYQRIEALDFERHSGWSKPVPLALPAPPAEASRDRLGADTYQMVLSGADALASHADINRRDRLFPGHFLTYETNPYSVAYGAAGVLHTLRQIRGSVPDPFVGWLLAGDYLTECPPGLYTGLAGVAWVLDDLGYPVPARRALAAAVDHELIDAEAGVLAGTAGVGLACLRRWRAHADLEALTWARRCGERIAAAAVHDERGAHWPVPDEVGASTFVPIGYARGSAGVALFLLYLHLATGETTWLELGRAGLDHDLSHAVEVKGHDGRTTLCAFPAAVPTDGERVSVVKDYWDEGTSGVAAALLRYLAVAPDPALTDHWRMMRPDLFRSYAVMPQLFHGLSSMGMALLDAAELIGDDAALDQAWRTAEGVIRFAITTPEGVSFPGEQCLRESTDLATGAAGVLLFLDRLGRAGAGTRTNTNFVVDELLDAAG